MFAGSRRLRRTRRNECLGEPALLSRSVSSAPPADRRREHRRRGPRLVAAYFVVARGGNNASAHSSSARRRAIRVGLLRSLRSLCLMTRCARCDVRWEPPSSPDPTKRVSRRTSAALSISFVGSTCRSAARTSPARTALGGRLLRRRTRRKQRLRSLLLSTAARDPLAS